MSVLGVFLVRIFPNSDWIRRDSEYRSAKFWNCCVTYIYLWLVFLNLWYLNLWFLITWVWTCIKFNHILTGIWYIRYFIFIFCLDCLNFRDQSWRWSYFAANCHLNLQSFCKSTLDVRSPIPSCISLWFEGYQPLYHPEQHENHLQVVSLSRASYIF